MNELTKTLVFLGVAAASVAVAVGTRPAPSKINPDEEVGKALFPEFQDPLAAKSLKIVRFDETLASLSEIEIKELNGLWTIPSHDGYPADAENRIRDAATPFVDLTPLTVVSDNEGDHPLYGVLEPSAEKSAVGDQGVGTLVSIKGQGGKDLVDLIIGKPVKDNEELRFVRRPRQSRVYLAKIDPSNLPVRFEDWIEKDLLQVESWDIKQMVLKDYSFQVAATLTGTVTDYDQRLEVQVTEEDGTWNLDTMKVAQGDKLQPTQLSDVEQLNQQKLNEMRNALDSLEIVNVERKPAKLGADLRAEDGFANDESGFSSLVERGFYPVSMPGGQAEVLSADGEVLVRTEAGVEYVLRFGSVEGVDTESGDGKLNRYLMVTARVSDAMLPEPELEPVPQSIEDLQPATEAAEPETDAPGESTSSLPAHGDRFQTTLVALQEEENDDSPEENESNSDENDATEPVEEAAEVSDEAAAEDAPADETANEPNDSNVAEENGAADEDAAAAGDESNVESEGTDEGAAAAEAVPTESTEDLEARLKAEQERITRENQRKIDEHKDKLEKAQQAVNELNYRFADWYYVISEDVYSKIHLGQGDIVEPVTADGEDASDATAAPPQFNFPPQP